MPIEQEDITPISNEPLPGWGYVEGRQTFGQRLHQLFDTVDHVVANGQEQPALPSEGIPHYPSAYMQAYFDTPPGYIVGVDPIATEITPPLEKIRKKSTMTFDRWVHRDISFDRVMEEMEREHNSHIAVSMRNAQYCSKDDDYIDYVGIAAQDNLKISYLNKRRIAACMAKDCDIWGTKSRYMANPSTVVEKMFPGLYHDKEKEEFTNTYRHIVTKSCSERFKIDIVHGKVIKKYYLHDNYSKTKSGFLNSELFCSCMAHDRCQEYFGIYTDNRDKVGMAVILDDEGRVRARCILWWPEGVKSEAADKFHDRIYAISSELKRGMQAQLENAGFINISDKNDIPPKRDDYEITIQLKHGEGDFTRFPYMDTMKFIEGNKLSNCNSNWRCLDDTEGNNMEEDEDEEQDVIRCAVCNNNTMAEEDDEGYVGSRHSIHYSEYLCHGHRRWSVYLDSWIGRGESVETWNGEYTTRNRHLILYNGEKVDKDDDDLVTDVSGNLFLTSDELFEEHNGKWYNIESEEYKQLKENELSI